MGHPEPDRRHAQRHGLAGRHVPQEPGYRDPGDLLVHQRRTIVISYNEDEGEANPPGYCTNPVVIPTVGATCIPTFNISAKDANVGAVATPGDHYGMLRSLEECYGPPLLNNAAAVNSSGQATYGDIKTNFASSDPDALCSKSLAV